MTATKDLEAKVLRELAAFCKVRLKGGKVLSAKHYSDLTGEKRVSALIDFGIKGVKKLNASIYDLDLAAGRVEPTLESLDMLALKRAAAEAGVAVRGRPNRVKLIIAIRKKERDERAAKVKAMQVRAEAKAQAKAIAKVEAKAKTKK